MNARKKKKIIIPKKKKKSTQESCNLSFVFGADFQQKKKKKKCIEHWMKGTLPIGNE